jgi:sugar phosphate isomerase/epimerase
VIEQFAVSQSWLGGTTFEQDIDVLVANGIGGLGVSEEKLLGASSAAVPAFLGSGLRATVCVPVVHTVPGGNGALDAALSSLLASVRRLASFDPVAIAVRVDGPTTPAPDPNRSAAIQVLRAMSRTAATQHPRGIPVAIEVSPPPAGTSFPGCGWLGAAVSLVEDVGEPDMGLVLDARLLSPLADEVVTSHLDLIAAVLVGDPTVEVPAGAPGAPGGDETGVRSVVTRLHRLGYRGWYEVRRPTSTVPRATGWGSDAGPETIAAIRRIRSWFESVRRDLGPLDRHRPDPAQQWRQ